MHFKITWPTGKVTHEIQSDVDTVENFINTRFGSAWESIKDFGAKVEKITEDEFHAALRALRFDALMSEVEAAKAEPVEETEEVPTADDLITQHEAEEAASTEPTSEPTGTDDDLLTESETEAFASWLKKNESAAP